jgi:hypothetical protein
VANEYFNGLIDEVRISDQALTPSQFLDSIPPVTITPSTLPAWTAGASFNQTLTASGGSGTKTFAFSSGILPPGLTFSTTGVISGIPTAAGGYSFTITATDSVGGSAIQSYGMLIYPAVALTTTTLANSEVEIPYSQTLSATGGTGSYTFALTSGTLPSGLTLSTSGILSGTPVAAGTFGFTMTASDSDGGSDSKAYSVTINPGVTIGELDLRYQKDDQGVAYSSSITAVGGTGSYVFTQTAGTLPTGITLSSSGLLHGTPTTPGAYAFTLRVTDSLGSNASQNYIIIINPPVTVTTGSLPDGSAGVAYNETITATGGTGFYTYGTTALPAGLVLSTDGVISGTSSAAGTFSFTVTATDSVGGSGSQSYTISLTPASFSQYLVTVFPGTIQAGDNFEVLVQAADQYGNPVGSYSGPAQATVTTSLIGGATTLSTPVAFAPSGFGVSLGNLTKVGTYAITVADSSNTYTGSGGPLTVTPGPAVKLGFASQPVNTPTGDVLPPVSVQVLDSYGNVVTSDNTDTVIVGIGNGPGAFTAGSATSAPVHSGVATFSGLTLVTPGTYQLSALVPTRYTGPYSSNFTVLPLQVVPGSFAGTLSGFSLQFNAPFLVNSLTPVLYGQGRGAAAPVPSVIVTTDPGDLGDTAAYVAGSLVQDTTNSLTFLATNTTLQANTGSPLLPPGTYTVIVHGGAAGNGFQALNPGGGFLDGLGTGSPGSGDFTTKFTVNTTTANTDVAWVPAVAQGPGQALNAPGMSRAGGGYPIFLTDGRGVTSVTVTVNYTPALLSLTGVTGPGFTLLGSSTPGHAVLQYSGPPLAPAPSLHEIPVTLDFLTATAPGGTAASTTPYRAADLLHLSGVSINGGAVPATTSDGLHLVAYPGDTSGDGTYSSDDALRITRVLLQADTGFAAYPVVDPVIVADTDGSGFIPADAALQVNEAGVGVPAANLPSPPIPLGVVFQPISNNVDPALSVGREAWSVERDGTITVPVNIDDADPPGSSGLIRGQLALLYDPQQFSVTAADIHLGSLLAAGRDWTVSANIDPITGQIGITVSSDTPISQPIGGSLVTIDFHQKLGEPGALTPGAVGPLTTPGADAPGSPASSSIALVASVDPNGQWFPTELEDAQGTFTLTPAPGSDFNSPIEHTFIAAPPLVAGPSRSR